MCNRFQGPAKPSFHGGDLPDPGPQLIQTDAEEADLRRALSNTRRPARTRGHAAVRQAVETLEHWRLLSVLGEAGLWTGAQLQSAGDDVFTPATTLSFDNAYSDPVIVGGTLGVNDGDPAFARFANVTATSAQLQIDEWTYQDGAHGSETVPYLVVEAGQHTLDDGSDLAAGVVSGSTSFTRVTFDEAFDGTPVVLAQVVAGNGAAVTTRLDNVLSTGFDVRLQTEQGRNDSVVASVHWIALDAAVSLAGVAFSSAGDLSMTNSGAWLSYGQQLSNQPAMFAQMQSFNDADPATVRRTSANEFGFYGFITEETSVDGETGHASEEIGFAAFNSGTLTGELGVE